MSMMQPHLNLLSPGQMSVSWQIYFCVSTSIFLLALLTVACWLWRDWNNHPISRRLAYFATSGSNWRSVASSIDTEFRRVDKFMTGHPGRRMYVTDSWVLKTTAYFVHVAHQGDVVLTLDGADHHAFTPESSVGVQYLNIRVQSINCKIKPFTIRYVNMEIRIIILVSGSKFT